MSTHWLVKDKADGTYLGTDGGWGKREEALKYADKRQAFEAADKRHGFGDSQPAVMRVTRRAKERKRYVIVKDTGNRYLSRYDLADRSSLWSQQASTAHVFTSRRIADRVVSMVSLSHWIVNPRVEEVSGG